ANFQLNRNPFVTKGKRLTALRTITGIINGEIKIEMTLPEVTARTINSGGYGSDILSKIPATRTITVNGPNPTNPSKITRNGKIASSLRKGMTDCIYLIPSTTTFEKFVSCNAKINTPTATIIFKRYACCGKLLR